jgi:hypothetical protein
MFVPDGTIKNGLQKSRQTRRKEWMRSHIRSLVSNRVEPRPEGALATFRNDNSICLEQIRGNAGHHTKNEAAGPVAGLPKPDTASLPRKRYRNLVLLAAAARIWPAPGCYLDNPNIWLML